MQNTILKPKKTNKFKTNLLMVGAGNMLASMTISGFIIGYLTDYLFNTIPLFLISFGLLGAIGGVLKVKDLMVADARRQQAKIQAQKKLLRSKRPLQ